MSPRKPFIILLTLVACHAPLRRDDPELPVDVPETFSALDDESDAPEEVWWLTFDAPELDGTIREALAHNHNLLASAQRVRAAAAIARIAGADRLPTVGAGANASREQLVFTGIPGPGGGVLTNRATTLGVSLDVAWELDLWGRLGARARSARADRDAAASDHRAARHSLAAQTAKAWFAWQEARLQRELAERTVDSFARTNDVVLRRFRSGRGSAFEVRSSEAELEGARALRSRRGEQVERVERQLELLLGRYPSGELDTDEGGARTAALPDVGGLPGAGVPSDLLLRRPDLRAAELRLLATDEALYEARASLYPQLTLSGSVGRTGTALDDLGDPEFDVWSLAAGLFQPLYQGGRLRANVDLAEAGVQEALQLYADAVLAAFTEVETSLAVDDLLASEVGFERTAAASARDAYALAQDRYAAGREDIASLLLAQRRALEAESRLLDVRRRRLEARVDLYLALGGGIDDAETTAQGATPDEDTREEG